MKTQATLTNSLKFKTRKTLRNGEILKVFIRLNDECGNGHEDFAITGELGTPRDYAKGNQSGGCIHDEILKHFPEFAPFVKLHLCDWEGSPMHGVANEFYWFAGIFPDANLQDYHGGTGRYGRTPEECKRILMESFRATEEDIATIAAANPRTAQEFSHAIENMGFRARWKAEAKAATRQLERLIEPDRTLKFKSTATRRNWEKLKPSEAKAIEERKASGYYEPEQVAARDAARKESARLAKIAEIEKDHAAALLKLENKRKVDLYFAARGICDRNAIYYDHTGTLQFNWSNTSRLWTRAEFDEFVAGVVAEELPDGLKFEFQERPKY